MVEAEVFNDVPDQRAVNCAIAGQGWSNVASVMENTSDVASGLDPLRRGAGLDCDVTAK